jgi:hypothetical protein
MPSSVPTNARCSKLTFRLLQRMLRLLQRMLRLLQRMYWLYLTTFQPTLRLFNQSAHTSALQIFGVGTYETSSTVRPTSISNECSDFDLWTSMPVESRVTPTSAPDERPYLTDECPGCSGRMPCCSNALLPDEQFWSSLQQEPLLAAPTRARLLPTNAPAARTSDSTNQPTGMLRTLC